MASSRDQTLSATQAHALLDILSHHEVYQEILDFRKPHTLATYGPPFQDRSQTLSTSPSLQTLVSKFLLSLPGLRDVSDDFWRIRIASIIDRFEEVELSESYDKGHIGIRKSLATAISSLVEYPMRGVFAGFEEPAVDDYNRSYDLSNPQDLQLGFRDIMHQAVYGHIVDDLIRKIGETDKLSDHTPLVQAAHEYGLVNIASFMHYALIISPKGQNLLSLIDQANKLVPYTLIKQTLRIGNVATMINAMVKVVLAKMSVSSITNWMGWTQNADEGMNLMQHIISQVLHWDVRDLKHKGSKLEKDKHGPTKDQLNALKQYLDYSREQHESMREISRSKSQSIVFAILDQSGVSTKFAEGQHKQAQDYLAIQLSIRDREQIVQVLCHSQPDNLSDAVRDLVSAYEPLIRQLHQAVDLSSTIADFEVFLKDTIKLAKMPDSKSPLHGKHHSRPTVGDFVELLKKHQASLHRFLHQVVKNCQDITSWFHEYALQAASYFRRTGSVTLKPGRNAGDLTDPLNELFASLPEGKRAEIIPMLDQHSKYISKLHAASATRLRQVVTSPPSRHPALQHNGRSSSQPGSRSSSPAAPANSSTPAGLEADPGPGSFLAKWQALIDATDITPAVPEGGAVRSGAKGSVLKASRLGPSPSSSLSHQSTSSTIGSGASKVSSSLSQQNTTSTQKSGASELDGGDDGTSRVQDDSDDDDEDVFEEAYERLDLHALREEEKVSDSRAAPIVDALGPAFRDMLAKRANTS